MTGVGSRSAEPSNGPGRRARTRYVVLGLLAQAPGSAYSLRQRIAASVGHFWQESFGQLYPTLAALEADGLIRGTDVTAGRRRRRDFEITAAGRATLAAWLREPPAPQPERNELLLKVFFIDEGDPRVLRGYIETAAAEATAQLEVLRAIERDVSAAHGPDPRVPFWMLTVRYGILGLEALERWSAEAIQAIDDAELVRSGEAAMSQPGKR